MKCLAAAAAMVAEIAIGGVVDVQVLEDRLNACGFPALQTQFRDSEALFSTNYLPTAGSAGQLRQFSETRKLLDAELEIFGWAVAAYQAMERAEAKCAQAAQSDTVDLITFFCDKALVPVIMPSQAGSSGIEAFAQVLPMLDKSIECCNRVLDLVVGGGDPAAIAAAAVPVLAEVVDCQHEIIKCCLDRCQTLKNDMGNRYSLLSEQLKASQAAENERREAAIARIEAESLVGEPDADIVAANAGKSPEERRAYNQELYDELHSRYLAFKEESQAAGASDLADKPPQMWRGVTNENAKQLFVLGKYPLAIGADEVDAMKADLVRQQQERGAVAQAMSDWNIAAAEKLIDARRRYREMYTDWVALELDGVARDAGDFGVGGRAALKLMESLIRTNHTSLCATDYELVAAEENGRMEDFIERRQAYHDTYVPEICTRYNSGKQLYLDAVAGYDAAWEELTAVLESLPPWVKSQDAVVAGSLEEAVAAHDMLVDCGEIYRRAVVRLETAKSRVRACAAAFENEDSVYCRWRSFYNDCGMPGAMAMEGYDEFSRSFKEHGFSEEQNRETETLAALERDFDDYIKSLRGESDAGGGDRREGTVPGPEPSGSDPANPVTGNPGSTEAGAGSSSPANPVPASPGQTDINPSGVSPSKPSTDAGSGPSPESVDPTPLKPMVEPLVKVVRADDITGGVKVAKSVVVVGVVLDGAGAVAGSIELKIGKPGKKGSKIAGSMQLLGGKKVSLKSGFHDLASGSVRVVLSGKGTSMTLKVGRVDGGDGVAFAGAQGAYSVSSAEVGGTMAKSSGLAVYVDPAFTLGVAGEILEHEGVSFVPFAGEPLALNGTKWGFGKAASIKFSAAKGSKDKTKVIQGHKDPKRPNISGMKLNYTTKKGTFKGSFKVYALSGVEGRRKLKKFAVGVEGLIVDGKGFGMATCRKPAAGPFAISVR